MSPVTTEARQQPAADEKLHELRAALFGVEASALAIARHRAALDEAEFDALALGLASEIRRIGAMLDGADRDVEVFDLAEAIGPAVTCARAAGVRIDADLPAGIGVIGRPDHAAQVVAGVIDNTRHHAPGSPVEVRIAIDDAWIRLEIADRGPTPTPAPAPAPAPARGKGSGIGLQVARRLMSAVGGTIRLRPRPGGGTIVEVAFRTGGAACSDAS